MRFRPFVSMFEGPKRHRAASLNPDKKVAPTLSPRINWFAQTALHQMEHTNLHAHPSSNFDVEVETPQGLGHKSVVSDSVITFLCRYYAE